MKIAMMTLIKAQLTFIFLLGLVSLSRAAERGLTLVDNGAPKATIVLSAQANEKAKFAAQELQTYLAKITGATLPIVTDAENPQGALVLVGRSKLTDAMKVQIPSGLTNARREEGFVIVCRGHRLVLAGNDEGPYHGTEYAVYDFLRRLGVRWFMPGEYGEVVPKQATITVPAMHVTEKPDFIMRNWWLHITPELRELERRWKIRNKMNPEVMFAIPGDSSVRNVLPESKYFKEHPEYFAMNPDGSRNPHHPNLTNPKTVEVVADIIKDYFRKNPHANSYGFAPDDGLPRDYSPETVKLNQGFVDLLGRPGVPGEVSTSEEWFTFVNKVTAAVRREFPEVYIATNGYANRNIPPQGVKLDDHLVVMFAAIWSCTLHAYDDPRCWQKVRQGQMLRRWCQLSKNVWVYGYNYQMLVSALTPLPETRKLRRDFPLMKQWGVIGFHDETRNVWAECGIASRYLRAQLEWNANADVDAILDDFYLKWYGKAAKPMRAFYEAIEDAIEKSPMHGHEDRVLPEIYTTALLTTLRQHISEAERLADTERDRLHVRAERLIFDHLEAYVKMSAAEAAGDFAAAAQHAGRMMELRKQLHAINPFYIWHDETRYHSGIWYWGVLDRQKYYQSLADLTSGKTGDLIALLPEKAAFRTDPHDDGLFEEWYLKVGAGVPASPIGAGVPASPTGAGVPASPTGAGVPASPTGAGVPASPAGAGVPASPKGWKTVSTTRPFYVQGYIDARGYPYLGYIWYRLHVDVPASAKGKKVVLYAPVVETEAWCWVNGQYVGHRPYQEAYVRPSPMEFDVTDVIRPGETNVIAVRVSTSLAAAQAASGILSRMFLYAPKAMDKEQGSK